MRKCTTWSLYKCLNKSNTRHLNTNYLFLIFFSLLKGELHPVTGEPGGAFDFLKPKSIGQDIGKVKGGYDHNMCLDKGSKSSGPSVRLALYRNPGLPLENQSELMKNRFAI